LVRGGERQVRLGQDRLAIKKSSGKNGNEWKLYTLFYPHPKDLKTFFFKHLCYFFAANVVVVLPLTLI
jgi:hypothetical protein